MLRTLLGGFLLSRVWRPGGIDTLIATSMLIAESKSKLPVINKGNESYHPHKTQHVFFYDRRRRNHTKRRTYALTLLGENLLLASKNNH